MNFPDTLYYAKEHTWAKPENDGIWSVGISDYAQDLLGDIVFIDLPKVDTKVVAGQVCGLVESVKTGSDLYAPVSGIVTEINNTVLNSPELLNDAPYENWLFRCKVEPPETASLLSAKDYQALIAS